MGALQDGDWYHVVGYVVNDNNGHEDVDRGQRTGRRGRIGRVDAIRIWRVVGKTYPNEWLKVVADGRRVDGELGMRVEEAEGNGRLWDGGGPREGN